MDNQNAPSQPTVLPATPNTIPQPGPVSPHPIVPTNAKHVPNEARDDELIEPEWVSAVRHIVDTNKHDPYTMSGAMANLRKYYLHKRYGRELDQAS